MTEASKAFFFFIVTRKSGEKKKTYDRWNELLTGFIVDQEKRSLTATGIREERDR